MIRMAFTNSQNIVNLQVQNLSFIPQNNTPIQSGYGLFINANGFVYFDKALDFSSLTRLSTDVHSYIDSIDASTLSTLYTHGSQLSQQSTLIDKLCKDVGGISTFVVNQLSTSYYSTNTILISTLYGISSFSSFGVQLGALETLIQSGLSTLSTTLSVENSYTYTTLQTSIRTVQVASQTYTDNKVANLASGVPTSSDMQKFSTTITKQLLSSVTGITATNASQTNFLQGQIYNLQQNLTMLPSFGDRITNLESMSTNLSTVTNSWISSYVQLALLPQTSNIYTSISSLSTVIGTNQTTNTQTASSLSQSISQLSTSYTVASENLSTLSSQLINLNYQVSSITTSGVIGSVTFSINQLSNYTLNLLNSMYISSQMLEQTLYSTTVSINQSVATSFFSTYVQSVYASTVSATTQTYTNSISTLVSTIYEFGISTIVVQTISSIPFYTSTAMIGLQSQIVSNANTALQNFLNGLKPLYSYTTLDITGSNPYALLNFSTYRNFQITIHDIGNATSNIRISYDPALIKDMDYARGCIFLHVSTPGQSYTLNNGKLEFDVYRWGVPTTVWGNAIPTIANSQYTIEYEYTIVQQTVFTNLLAVYPILYVSAFHVYIDNSTSDATTYAGFPFGLSFYWNCFDGAKQYLSESSPHFDTTVTIDVAYQYDTQYNFSIMNLPFQSPYPSAGTSLQTGGANTLPKGSQNQTVTFTARITGQMNLAYSKRFTTLALWYAA